MDDDIFLPYFDDDARYKAEFKNKGYPHFDSSSPQKRLIELLSNIDRNGKVSHSFYPLIKYDMPKYKRDDKGKICVDREKPRKIMHTARLDANIYAYYRNILMNHYESQLKVLGIDDCVIAYRKIPISNAANSKNKCNLHFANEALEEIKRQTSSNGNCCAIAMDIKGFFDNLDHTFIKRRWASVMGWTKGLSAEHFEIYRNITRYRHIDEKKLGKILGISLSKIKLNNNLIRKKRAEAGQRIMLKICDGDDLKNKVMPNCEENNQLGIPQGTTISDVIANLYMLDFDVKMKKFSLENDGYYRRYSDDILFICPTQHQQKAISFITEAIKLEKLTVSAGKTLISDFTKDAERIECKTYKGENLRPINKPFEYLGLSFDGKSKRIRKSTISCYYDKLSERIKKEVDIAHKKLVRDQKPITSSSLFQIVSFDMIRNAYMENRSKSFDDDFCGNFYTYLSLAQQISGNPSILDLFDRINPWIRTRAKKFCDRIEYKAALKSP